MVLNDFKLKHYMVFVLVISSPHVMRALAWLPWELLSYVVS